MHNVFVYPASEVNYKKTIKSSVPLENIYKFIRDENNKRILASQYAPEGGAYLWAVNSAVKKNALSGSDENPWNKLKVCD